ncbi:MAG: EpsD family peptidyl-prolyl cis-trans isomerase [Burkholderiales bacterium]|nr:EpsD family peptidyl-prolyl cis-trans isomerase [Burkholderiales bacterium]
MKTRSAFPLALTLACVAVLLAACGRTTEDSSAMVATVNGEKITQDQLDFAVKQITAARPGASAPAAATVLESLVQQRLAVQKAEKDKLDRNPAVLQALEAARKDALARYYIEQFVAKVPKPGADEVKQYFDAHPANFAQRNAYVIQKVDARVAADQAGPLAAQAQAASGAAAVATLLKAKASAVNVTESTQPAESLGPLLPKISTMSAGQTVAIPQPQGLTTLTLVEVKPLPLTLAQAQPAIEQMLWNQKKREALLADTKDMRSKARIDYLGKFAPGTVSATAASAPVAASGASQ